MTKKEQIEALATATGMTKADAQRSFSAMFEIIADAISEEKYGRKISIAGFGTFKTAKREARIARNPKTGAEIEVSARWAVSFKPGTPLKARYNNES